MSKNKCVRNCCWIWGNQSEPTHHLPDHVWQIRICIYHSIVAYLMQLQQSLYLLAAGQSCRPNVIPERRKLHSKQICTDGSWFCVRQPKTVQSFTNVILNTNSKLSTSIHSAFALNNSDRVEIVWQNQMNGERERRWRTSSVTATVLIVICRMQTHSAWEAVTVTATNTK